MLLKLTRLFLLLLLLMGFSRARAQSGSFAPVKFKAGMGYEFLSQEFFLQAVSDTSTDPLLDQVSLETTYLDDLKGLVGLIYSPYVDQRLRVEAQYEQTPELLRTRLLPEVRLKWGATKLDIRGEMDVRRRYRDSAKIGDSYSFGRFDSKLSVPLATDHAIVFRVLADVVQFDSTGDYTFNYHRLGGRVGWRKSMPDFSFLDLDLFAVSRWVADSTDLNYMSLGAEGRYYGFLGQTEWDLFGRLEHKNYNFNTERDDFDRGEIEAHGRIPVSGPLSFRPELDFSITSYSPADPVNFDYYQLKIEALGSLEQGELTISAGPALEVLDEAQGDLTFGEDYTEYGLSVQLDYFRLGKIFGSLESTSGYRNLLTEDDFQSDFYFERVNLLADAKLTGGLRFDILFAGEWEWHRVSTDDSRIFLFNSGLTYYF